VNRNLPGPMVDLIRDGAPPTDLRRDGQRAVWSALFRTAASAAQRGWDGWEWECLVREPSSVLGRQASTRDGRRLKTEKSITKTYADAWDRATAWVSEQPPMWRHGEAVEQALRRADLLAELAADPDATLPQNSRAVLAHAAKQARRLTSDRPALPRQQMLEATGLGLSALRTALARLDGAGLLVLAERGRRGASGGRSNLYRLAREDHPALACYLYRETRSVVPPGQVCSAPRLDLDGAPRQVCSAPRPGAPTKPTPEGLSMVTLTLTAPDADALAAALAALRREQDVAVHEIPDKVRHLRSVVEDEAS